MSDLVTPVTIRRAVFGDLADLSRGHGLEIGPLAAPIVTPEMGDVRYVDVDTREALMAHYDAEPSVDCSSIPEIDYWLKTVDGIQSLSRAVAEGSPFDWVVASHVVEHVPDLVGWFAEIAEVIKDDGPVLLVVPDRRFCFDIHRPATTVGQLIQAHQDGDLTPSVRAVYDHHRSCVPVLAHEAWAGQVPSQDTRIYTHEQVMEAVETARDGEYVDSHVWTFTPRSFVAAMEDLGLLGDLHFTITTVLPTRMDQLEFYVQLTRIPRGTPAGAAAQMRSDALAKVLGSLPDESMTPAHQHDAERLGAAEDTLRDALRTEQGLRSQVQALADQVDDSRRQLEAIRASTTWRAGRLLVRPASLARRALRRRAR